MECFEVMKILTDGQLISSEEQFQNALAHLKVCHRCCRGYFEYINHNSSSVIIDDLVAQHSRC